MIPVAYSIRADDVAKYCRSNANVAIHICPEKKLRIPWPIRDEAIQLVVKFDLFSVVKRMIRRAKKKFDVAFGSLRMCVGRAVGAVLETQGHANQPSGVLRMGLGVERSSLPALAHAWVRSGPSIIITPALVRPCAWGFDSIPWWNIM